MDYSNKKKYIKRTAYTKEQIQNAVLEANCYSDIFRNLGIKINGGSYVWMKNLLKKFEIEVNFINQPNINFLNAGIKSSAQMVHDLYKNTDDISKEKRLSSKKLRTFLLYKGKKEECEVCGLTECVGKKIRLDIHHKDGDCYNNHLNNLQFICPNCHRQETITFKEIRSWKGLRATPKFENGLKKQKDKDYKKCCDCDTIISYDAKRCTPCHLLTRQKINWPDNETLENLVRNYSLLSLGKSLGVSDNAIKKRCKARNIQIPKGKKKLYYN